MARWIPLTASPSLHPPEKYEWKKPSQAWRGSSWKECARHDLLIQKKPLMNGRLFCLLAEALEHFVRIMIVLSSSGNHFLATFPFCQSIMGIFLHDEKIAPALLELHGNDQVVHNVIPRRSLCESGKEVFFELEGKLAIFSRFFPKISFCRFCRWNLSHSSLLSSTCLKIFGRHDIW